MTFRIVIFLLFSLINLFAQPAYSSEKDIFEFRKNLDQYLATQVAQGKFSGSVLIAQNNNIIFNGAYGFANREYNARNKVNTKFNLASIGKLFTSVAIAQLEQEGKLHLSDPVG